MSPFSIVVKASTLSPKFNAKHFAVKCSAVKRFVSAPLLVYQMGMHKLQCNFDAVGGEPTDYMCIMHPLT
jgi:hypothetical protein